ncbi:MAG: hypothetical protein RIE22_05270 [Alphaproteobacteria bacterium]
MKLFVVNGSDPHSGSPRSWVCIAQNNVNLLMLLPDDFEAEKIYIVADGLKGKDRTVGYADGVYEPAA